MTTAHRPTWNPARGGGGKNEKDLSKLSQQYSSRDMPGETKLKYRHTGQSSSEEVRGRDFRRELEHKERQARKERVDKDKAARDSWAGGKKPRLDQITSGDLDADDPIEEDDSSDSGDSDDEAELLAELGRIKKERAAEKAATDARQAEQRERIRTENILQGNPLLGESAKAQPADFHVRRRWDDDVVFKNCAKGIDERARKPTFVNDAIRSEFHRKFMEKYIA